MPWTPLTGAKFEDVFGPTQKARQRKRSRRPRADKRDRVHPKLETLEIRTVPALVANVLATSLASASGNNATIGEVVRYRVQVEVPADSNTYQSMDVDALLPSGLTYLDDGSTKIALVSNGGITSSLASTGSSLYVSGDESTVGGITPTFVLPSNAITTSAGGVDFRSGITQVTDSDANKEYILIEFNALVNNTGTSAADSNDAGEVLGSNFQLFVDGNGSGPSVGGQAVTVVEASITDLAKSVQISADGSTATYTLTFSNASGPNSSTAYNVRVLDTTPAGLTLDPNSITVVGGTGVSNNSTASQLDVNLASVAPGGSVTITYTAAVDAAARDGRTITNTVDLDYTSLPNQSSDSSDPNVSDTPGTPGSATRARDGSGGINDYVDTASANFTADPQVAASISGFVKCDESPFFQHGANDFDAISGVTIRLLDSTGTVIDSATTDSNGFYQFTGLAPGTYRVEEVQPAGTQDSFDMVGEVNGQTVGTTGPNNGIGTDFFDGIALAAGDAGQNYCFFDICDTAQISGFVKCQNVPGEPGIQGVTITLEDDATGAFVAMTTTDNNGFFQFTNLAAGTYRIVEDDQNLPAGTTDLNFGQPGTINGVTVGTAGQDANGNDIITNITVNAGDDDVMNCFLETCQVSVDSGFACVSRSR